jgi:hypothetical protein
MRGWQRRWRTLPSTVIALVLLAGACTDDGGDADAEAPPPRAEVPTTDLDAFCDAYVEAAAMTAGPPRDDPRQFLAAMIENAPGEIADDAETLAAQFELRIEAAGPPLPEYLESSARVGLHAAENCADEQLEVTAVDHEFEGIPSTMTAGRQAIVLTNEGSEWHEVIIFRKSDGVTEPYAALLEMPDSGDMATGVGGAFAGPGERSGIVVDLAPGEYAAVCFIPVGTTSLDGALPDPIVPHFAQGMVNDFSVVAS